MTTTEKSKLVVLNPTAAPREMVQTMAPVLDGLGGQSVGFLWNSKPNGDLTWCTSESQQHRSQPRKK